MYNYPQHFIFYPMLAMFTLTLFALLINVYTRVTAVRLRKIKVGYFKTFQGEASDRVIQVGNHVNNLFQAPPLFYTICLLILFFSHVDGFFVFLAWIYFIFRTCHSFIHLTTNYIPLRMGFYVLSTFTLALMWIRLATILSI